MVFLDYVSDELLARLLRSAAAFASTSEYEGYGLPALEAMAAGTPLLPSPRRSFARYVATPSTLSSLTPRRWLGDCARWPGQRSGPATERCRAITAEQYGWERVVHGVLSAYLSAATMKQHNPQRGRVAWS